MKIFVAEVVGATLSEGLLV